MKHTRTTANSQAGFTIIELMIATVILSTMLLVVTVLMINIGNLYYKGVSQARVQDSVRNVADDVTQQLKFGTLLDAGSWTETSGSTNFTENAYCIGSTRYTYIIGYQIGTGTDFGTTPQVPHVLWRDTNPTPGSCTNQLNLFGSLGSGTEMIAPNSRLTSFSITASATLSSTYTVTVGEAYGSKDLLNPDPPIDSPPTFVTCKGITGDRFCATSHLTTIVSKRITGQQ
jgi:prepilin-type N-terminal cleavage/methylation domain-containing protein